MFRKLAHHHACAQQLKEVLSTKRTTQKQKILENLHLEMIGLE